jgi:hypothetical protein
VDLAKEAQPCHTQGLHEPPAGLGLSEVAGGPNGETVQKLGHA